MLTRDFINLFESCCFYNFKNYKLMCDALMVNEDYEEDNNCLINLGWNYVENYLYTISMERERCVFLRKAKSDDDSSVEKKVNLTKETVNELCTTLIQCSPFSKLVELIIPKDVKRKVDTNNLKLNITLAYIGAIIIDCNYDDCKINVAIEQILNIGNYLKHNEYGLNQAIKKVELWYLDKYDELFPIKYEFDGKKYYVSTSFGEYGKLKFMYSSDHPGKAYLNLCENIDQFIYHEEDFPSSLYESSLFKKYGNLLIKDITCFKFRASEYVENYLPNEYNSKILFVNEKEPKDLQTIYISDNYKNNNGNSNLFVNRFAHCIEEVINDNKSSLKSKEESSNLNINNYIDESLLYGYDVDVNEDDEEDDDYDEEELDEDEYEDFDFDEDDFLLDEIEEDIDEDSFIDELSNDDPLTFDEIKEFCDDLKAFNEVIERIGLNKDKN